MLLIGMVCVGNPAAKTLSYPARLPRLRPSVAAGMDGYVSKPVQAKELFEAIERLHPIAACGQGLDL
jgi:CheY-like chemotaxis protein